MANYWSVTRDLVVAQRLAGRTGAARHPLDDLLRKIALREKQLGHLAQRNNFLKLIKVLFFKAQLLLTQGKRLIEVVADLLVAHAIGHFPAQQAAVAVEVAAAG